MKIIDAALLRHRLMASLYTDAMLLADDTRAYAEHRDVIDDFGPVERVMISCEQLRLTTRLMTVLAWLLAWRAVDAGEMPSAAMPRLDPLPPHDPAPTVRYPGHVGDLIEAGVALYRRAAFLDARIAADADKATPSPSPALAIQRRLVAAL